MTNSPDFPVTTRSFDTLYAADGLPSDAASPGTNAYDAFIARLTLDAPVAGDATPPAAPTPPAPPPPPPGGPALADVTLGGSPGTLTVFGASRVQATVTLSAPAPAGGATVQVASTIPSRASVPPSVTVAAGNTTASFTVTNLPA